MRLRHRIGKPINFRLHSQRTLKIQHPLPSRQQHSLHAWTRPKHGSTQKIAKPDDISEKLLPSGVLRVQQILDSILYYVLAIDCKLLAALGNLVLVQNKARKYTWDVIVWRLDYVVTHPDVSIVYHANKICIHTDSNVSYLLVSHAGNRPWPHFY